MVAVLVYLLLCIELHHHHLMHISQDYDYLQNSLFLGKIISCPVFLYQVHLR
ncbi:hypothetical protein [Paenibacillus xylanilyticus]|uniref:hypothetical protein n=1 Tax=Paenibacillus xylanilyticus TaxID=248903 RepID=UPI0039A31B2C